MNLPRFVIAEIQNVAAGSLDDKINYLIQQRAIMSDQMIRERVESVLGLQSDSDWNYLTALADDRQRAVVSVTSPQNMAPAVVVDNQAQAIAEAQAQAIAQAAQQAALAAQAQAQAQEQASIAAQALADARAAALAADQATAQAQAAQTARTIAQANEAQALAAQAQAEAQLQAALAAKKQAEAREQALLAEHAQEVVKPAQRETQNALLPLALAVGATLLFGG